MSDKWKDARELMLNVASMQDGDKITLIRAGDVIVVLMPVASDAFMMRSSLFQNDAANYYHYDGGD